MAKTCFRCKLVKPLAEFNKATGRKDGVQSRCRVCDQEMGRAAYRANPQRFRRNNTGARQRAREAVWEYLVGHPCIDCGETDPVVLEFDHTGEIPKEADISKMVGSGYAVTTIMDEIKKCVVRCANCHRRKTRVQLGWWARDGAPQSQPRLASSSMG